VFNALTRLAEEPGGFAAGESPLELEARADHILESPPGDTGLDEDTADDFEAIEPELPPGTQLAHLVPFSDTLGDETVEEDEHSFEFTLPPGDLDRIFIEAKPLVPPAQLIAKAKARSGLSGETGGARDTDFPAHDDDANDATDTNDSMESADAAHATDTTDAGDGAHAPDTTDAADAWHPADAAHAADREHPGLREHPWVAAPQSAQAHDFSAEIAALIAETALPGEPPNPPTPPTDAAPGFAAHPQPEETLSAAASGSETGVRTVGMEVPERVRPELLDEIQRPPEAVLAPPRRRVALRSAWIVAAVLLVLLLAAQVIDHYRQDLASGQMFGSALRDLYASLGNPLPEPVNLTVYQLRQWGVSGDPSASSTLRVRASILNTTAEFQSFPLLRVTLTNRYGNRIGSRDFEPSEYLGKPSVRRMAPGERAEATLDILDPGKSAEGFEIDVCLRGADRRLACANEVATHSQ